MHSTWNWFGGGDWDRGDMHRGYFYVTAPDEWIAALLTGQNKIDKQIKYKGYRIELQEIENAIEHLNECENCTVCVLKNKAGSIKKIFSFVCFFFFCKNRTYISF